MHGQKTLSYAKVIALFDGRAEIMWTGDIYAY